MNAPHWLQLPERRAVRDRRKRPGRARTARRVIAWDGEGANLDSGEHAYILLANSTGEAIESGAGLRTLDCLDFMVSMGRRYPRALHVAFAFSYDANMILRDLPAALVIDLWHQRRVEWHGYRLHYRQRKEWNVYSERGSLRVWDVFGFFQSSFVTALRAWNVPVDVDAIEAMKARRSTFTLDQLPAIRSYCFMECTALATLAGLVLTRSREAGVTLTRYDGAGAVASALLRSNEVDRYRAPAPELIEAAARAAYYGGRIELVRFGHHAAPVYAYDLRSAYPAALAAMPCLACGRWEWSTNPQHERRGFALYRVSWDLTGNVLPFPWRDPHGGVWYPERGRGWLWGYELDAARRALAHDAIAGTFRVHEAYVYHTDCECEPFGWVEPLYCQRREWAAANVAAEKILKLGLNSLYGKTAQRVGGRFGPPRWHQVEWAGAVTSRTRAALYVASLPAIRSRALCYYATDAILSTAPLELDTGDGLGQWEPARHECATLVQSGVYWLGSDVAHTRGFVRDELDRTAVLDSWARGRWTLEHSVTRFRAMGLALVQGQGRWREWTTEPRTLHLEPTGTKRRLEPGARLSGRSRIRPDRGLIPTRPGNPRTFQELRGLDSAALTFPWAAVRRGFDGDELAGLLDALDESDLCTTE